MIEINCPHCGFALRIKPKYAGREGKCAKCNGRLRVPDLEPAVETTPREISVTPTPPGLAPVSTSLEDLQEDNLPPVVDRAPAATVAGIPKRDDDGPRPEFESTALDDLDKVENWQDEWEGAESREPRPAGARLTVWYWVLAVVAAPVALVWGLVLPRKHPKKMTAILAPIVILVAGGFLAFTVFAVVGTAFHDDDSASAAASAVTPQVASSGAVPAASEPGRPHQGAPAVQRVSVYEATGLPTYPGLTFRPVSPSENPAYVSLGVADPSTTQTFCAMTNVNNDEICKSFFQQFEAQNWTITDSGYREEAHATVFILGEKNGEKLAYCTAVTREGLAVYITLARGEQSAATTEGATATAPIDEFPHYPGLTLTATSSVPDYVGPTGRKPYYQSAFDGTVMATLTDVAEFYKDALDGGRWSWNDFSQPDEPNPHFLAKGGRGDFRYVLQGKPVARGTHVVLGFVQPGTPF